MSIEDCAHYRPGVRQNEGPLTIERAASEAAGDDEFVWLDMYEPSIEEMEMAAREFDLPELAVEDAEETHQRPKIEDYDGDRYFVVLRTARYDDDREAVDFGEITLFPGLG